MNLNKVIIIGRATATPEVRKTPGGQSVTSFSIATNRVWSGKDGSKQEETEFTNVVIWGRQAEVASQFVVKGALLCVEGRLKTRSWEDKQGGKHKATEVIVEKLQLGPRPQNSGMAKEERAEKNEEIPSVDIDEGSFGAEENGEIKSEDLPF